MSLSALLDQSFAYERPTLTPYAEPIQVGTCPLAEKYFLEISDAFVRRKGKVNVLVSDAGEPLLLEKVNLGDNHSCISVEACMKGVPTGFPDTSANAPRVMRTSPPGKSPTPVFVTGTW